ncbi:shikimate dehydrogenase family protein [Agrobacterium tumefaciens]|uniref:shikimate dehydrogenase family protein n=1 Tax=Agrobacterium tumefaciens TaxID=358 RepID=UPI0009B76AC0|nr:shikimate dehydrogenase [Agrobacterium tumefaciens]
MSQHHHTAEMPEQSRLITGKTRVFGILADPIYHVKTPQTMNTLFASHGLDCVLVPFHVTQAGLRALIEGLREMQNFGGFITTVPHKSSMLELCDRVTDSARHIGAVNCVRREDDGTLVGTMLDGIGFVEAMRSRGVNFSGMRVFLVGAGGASSAIAFGLADAGISHITISNRSAARTAELAKRLNIAYPDLSISSNSEAIERHDLIVNGTTLGMRDSDAEPVDFSKIRADQLVADAIMEPAMTPLLAAAHAKGCMTFPGRPMLESQILLMAGHMGAFPT